LRRSIRDDDVAGTKRAVNRTGGVRGVKGVGNRADARDQIVDRGWAEVAEGGVKGNAASHRCNREWRLAIES
jgi:hypothetical protein